MVLLTGFQAETGKCCSFFLFTFPALVQLTRPRVPFLKGCIDRQSGEQNIPTAAYSIHFD